MEPGPGVIDVAQDASLYDLLAAVLQAESSLARITPGGQAVRVGDLDRLLQESRPWRRAGRRSGPVGGWPLELVQPLENRTGVESHGRCGSTVVPTSNACTESPTDAQEDRRWSGRVALEAAAGRPQPLGWVQPVENRTGVESRGRCKPNGCTRPTHVPKSNGDPRKTARYPLPCSRMYVAYRATNNGSIAPTLSWPKASSPRT